MSLIDHFLTGTYKVKRSTGGSYPAGAFGQYVPGETVEIDIRGSLQPTNARELKIPEEGARLRQYWKFYSDEEIFTIRTASLGQADVVEIDGETYKVMSIEKWQGLGVDLPYFMTVLYREPENP